MDGIDFVGYLVDGFLERTDVYGRGRDSVERQIRSLVESIEANERDARVHEYLHGYDGGCPIEEKKIEVLR